MPFEITFAGRYPLSRPASRAFLGWASQVHLEVVVLLQERDANWLNGVADQIRSVMAPPAGEETGWRDLLLDANPSRTAGTPFPYLVGEAGQLGLFAAREPRHDWSPGEPQTEQWERYAVFAALSIFQALKRVDAAEDASPHSDSLLHEAGGLSIEAVRALQIAHSLKAGSLQRATSASGAAKARHAKTEPYKNRAIANTLAMEFPSMVKAVDHLTENEPIDQDGKKFASRRAAEEWLRKAGFRPTKKRTLPG